MDCYRDTKFASYIPGICLDDPLGGYDVAIGAVRLGLRAAVTDAATD